MTILKTTDRDKAIIAFFITNDNKRTHASGIATKSGDVCKSWSGKRCAYLESKGALTHVMIKPFRSKDKTEYYYIASTPHAVSVLVNMFKYDRPMQQVFMNSQYYHDMIPALVRALNDSLADLELCMRDIVRYYNHYINAIDKVKSGKTYIEPPEIARMTEPIHTFSDTELKKIESTLRCNWSMLCFIMHYLSSDVETKRQLLLEVLLDSQLVTSAAGKAGGLIKMATDLLYTFLEHGDGEAADHVINTYRKLTSEGEIPPAWYVPDIHKELCPNGEMHPVWAAGELPSMWFTDLFNHISWLCDRYLRRFD